MKQIYSPVSSRLALWKVRVMLSVPTKANLLSLSLILQLPIQGNKMEEMYPYNIYIMWEGTWNLRSHQNQLWQLRVEIKFYSQGFVITCFPIFGRFCEKCIWCSSQLLFKHKRVFSECDCAFHQVLGVGDLSEQPPFAYTNNVCRAPSPPPFKIPGSTPMVIPCLQRLGTKVKGQP